MRFLAIVLLAACTSRAYGELPPDFVNKAGDCLREFNVISGIFDTVKENGIEGIRENPGKIAKCSTKCFFQAFGVINEAGKWDKEKIKGHTDMVETILTFVVGSEEATEWKNGIEACIDADNAPDNECSEIWTTVRCARKVDIKTLKKILDKFGKVHKIIDMVYQAMTKTD